MNTAVAGVVAVWVGRFGDSPLWMLASLVTGTIVYIVMSLVFHFLDDREKELVNRFCKLQLFKV